MSPRVTDVAELTPVERHDSRFYKRDDLFEPFDDVPVNGGKVRQAMLLLANQRERIVDEFGGLVLTATGVHSPQGLIVARVAASLGLSCRVFCGAGRNDRVVDVAKRHPIMRRVLEVGATLDVSTKIGYEAPLAATIARWRAAHDNVGYVVRFGINLEDDFAAVIDSTATQVDNLPADVERVVIPVGAGITAAGIIIGLRRLRPDVDVICVQIAGHDRRDTIDRIVGSSGGYRWHELTHIPYATALLRRVDSVTLDPIYEAKAHDFVLASDELSASSSLFWIVGDSTAVRHRGATARCARQAVSP